jgi:hypothetical protein
MARRQVRDKSCSAKRHRLAVVQNLIDRVSFPTWLYPLKGRHILRHCDDLSSSQLLDQRVSLLMISVRVTAEQDFGIGELEPELLNGFLNGPYISLVRTVDEYVSLRRDDQKRTQRSGSQRLSCAVELSWSSGVCIPRDQRLRRQFAPER